MKYLLLLLLFGLAASTGLAQTRHDITMNVEGVQREFIVVRPSGAVPAAGYPVVMMFHGTSGDGEKFYNISGWKEKGEEEKFITVFPSSLEYCIIDSGRQNRTTKWNNGDLASNACPGQTFKDDVRFVRRMLDTIRNQFRIDSRRIYASGFSNGGVFTSKLAVEMSDVFAAITVAAGVLHQLDSAEPRRNIPIAYIIGSRDRVIEESGGPAVVPFNDSALGYVGGLINRYLTTFDLARTFTKTETAATLTWLFNTPASSAPATEYSFTLLRDMPHMYPNGTNYPVSAPNGFWQFYQRFTLVSGIEDEATATHAVTIHPNPARSYLRITGVGAGSIVVRNMLGEAVLEQRIDGDGLVQLEGVRSGHYLLEIRRADGVVTRRLVVE